MPRLGSQYRLGQPPGVETCCLRAAICRALLLVAVAVMSVGGAEPDSGEALPADLLPDPADLRYEGPPCVPVPTYYDFLENQPLTLRMEYVHWWLSGNPLPPLVTSSPNDTPLPLAGVLGQAGTSTLFGGRDVDDSGRKGFRGTLGVRLGYWSDRLAGCELQADVIVVGHDQASGDFLATSTQTPILARPYADLAAGGVPAALPVAYPGLTEGPFALQRGSVATDTSSRLNGAGLALRRAAWTDGAIPLGWTAGYRYLRFQEQLDIGQSQLFTEPAANNRITTLDAFDSFSVFNDFHGAELGLLTQIGCGPGSLEVVAKLALGNLHRALTVRGETIVASDVDGVLIEPGGLLTQPSNLGRHTSDRFVAATELGVTLRRTLGRSLSATVGYTLIALPEVIRTGDQIDTTLDFRPAATRPRAPLHESVLLIQGVNVGLEW